MAETRKLNEKYPLTDEEKIQLKCLNHGFCIKINCTPKKCPYKSLESRIAKAQELPQRAYDHQVEIVRLVCHNITGEMLQGEKLQDTVIFHLRLMKNELVEALGALSDGP